MLWLLHLLLLVVAACLAWLPRGWPLVGALFLVQGTAAILVAGVGSDGRVLLGTLATASLLLAAGAGALSRRLLRGAQEPATEGTAASPLARQVALFQVLSLPCAWIAWQGFAAFARASDSPLRGHAIALVALAASLALGACAVRWRARGSAPPAWISAPLAAVAVVAGWSTLQAFVLRAAARELAAGQPFCIQLPQARDRYAAARSIGDLSGFVALERGQNHAVLVAGAPGRQRFFHWSHRAGRFLPVGTPVLDCRPDAAFTAALGVLPEPARPARRSDALLAVLEGRPFLLPHGYGATTLGSPRNLRFHAALPDFAPGTASTVDLDAIGLCEPVEPRVHRGRCLWINEPTAYVQVTPAAAEHGLARQHVVAGTSTETEWFARDAQGRVTTRIACGSPRSGCTQQFQAAGVTLHITHGAELVPRWRELQAALLERVRGFEAAGRQEADRLQSAR